MNGMTRESVHTKVDEIFDGLDKLNLDNTKAIVLCRVLLQVNDDVDHSITGVILAHRDVHPSNPYITWGVAPYGAGLHSGHYDMTDVHGEDDWSNRCKRGW